MIDDVDDDGGEVDGDTLIEVTRDEGGEDEGDAPLVVKTEERLSTGFVIEGRGNAERTGIEGTANEDDDDEALGVVGKGGINHLTRREVVGIVN